MKNKVYIGNCPNCGRKCVSGLKTTSCWNCETKFTIPTDMQEISFDNSTSIETKECDNDEESILDKLDEIITKQIDRSNNQVECQTLRWVLDVMSAIQTESEE